MPGRGECRGRSYADTVWVLDELSQQLQRSADSGDATRFLEAAVAVVHWGGAGVKQNEGKLRTLGDKALPLLTANARLLDPDAADLCGLSGVRPMNSGFSKLYSLLVDGFRSTTAASPARSPRSSVCSARRPDASVRKSRRRSRSAPSGAAEARIAIHPAGNSTSQRSMGILMATPNRTSGPHGCWPLSLRSRPSPVRGNRSVLFSPRCS